MNQIPLSSRPRPFQMPWLLLLSFLLVIHGSMSTITSTIALKNHIIDRRILPSTFLPRSLITLRGGEESKDVDSGVKTLQKTDDKKAESVEEIEVEEEDDDEEGEGEEDFNDEDEEIEDEDEDEDHLRPLGEEGEGWRSVVHGGWGRRAC